LESQTPDEGAVLNTAGPVQAEVFVLRLRDGAPEVPGPRGPDPWYIEVGAEEDPVEVVVRLSRNLMGEPVLAHSTSWRRDRGSVVLSFVVVIGEDQAPALAGAEVARSELARSSATAAPAAIASAQVLEHGLRHLAWLAKEDEVDREVLSPEWHGILSGYVLEQRGGGRRVRNPGGIALRGRDQVREYMPILWSAFPT
jgi:hypothetical protein